MTYSQLVENMSSHDILDKFPDIIPLRRRPNSKSSESSSAQDAIFTGHDEEQIKLMNENCIVLDWNDNAIGSATKKMCHLMTNINRGLLHRAFSVFLFNSENKLLLQQRASEKITFPCLWTNTCCSHPLCIDDEIGSNHHLDKKIQGAIVAATRKLNHELGIPTEEIERMGKFHFLNRIHYMAPSNEPWGEHEIDYILFYKLNYTGTKEDLTVNPNVNEVRDYKWVSMDELKSMLEDPNLKFTPWFNIICESYLFKWWAQIDDIEKVENDTKIHRML
ncbi:isopentenyl-diphosphate delta-isomerase IDI1 NDAI_0E02450 [Naumovozyma dairenensis CBS 421]|uniref:Isopentenyl-diphosphate Delta-isomerase n=1 Tax=Naumovozyma dairenensis (strain ATCC 10597 / BCRC 20456 / CBS 421 / NBRC 0211 / NRRL Y-12639) TaxID=1071378 RepID=G0WBE2_NAUDC|nr:hypothetical protein NDAI_0E02450 [Naumovozyma dairenensis CBS 421]CCD25062.1 hypothetical protein NDAI_0E02450 [Naumovozyma dairenensis CBS 421]